MDKNVKENNAYNIKELLITIMFIGILLFFMFSLIFRGIQNINVINDKVSTVFINWEKIYPYEKEEATNKKQENLYNNFMEKVEIILPKIEMFCEDYIVFRMSFVKLNAYINKLIGINIVHDAEDDVVKMKNGAFTFCSKKVNIESHVKNIVDLNNFLQQKNIEFCYIQAPGKIDKYNSNLLPKGVDDYSNENADQLLQSLNKNNISTFDLREEIFKEKLDYNQLFFLTDHHWKPETGLWATHKIAKFLNENNNFMFKDNLFDLNNYNIDVIKKCWLGSQGKKVSQVYAEPEDISIITPKFSSDLSLTIPSQEVQERGKFEDIMIDYSRFDNIDYNNSYLYEAYLRDNNPIVNIHNYNIHEENNKKLLIISNSYNLVVSPFLSLGLKDINVLNLSYFTGSVKSFIQQTNPNMVIVLYHTGSIVDFDPNEKTELFVFD